MDTHSVAYFIVEQFRDAPGSSRPMRLSDAPLPGDGIKSVERPVDHLGAIAIVLETDEKPLSVWVMVLQ